MSFVLPIVVVAAIVGPVLLIGMAVAQLYAELNRLKREVRALERRLDLHREDLPPAAPKDAPPLQRPEPSDPGDADPLQRPDGPEAPPSLDTPVPLPSAARSARPFRPERIAMLVAAGLGGIALTIGLVLALVVVLEHNLLGPAARVAGGMVVGTAFWWAGLKLRGRLLAVPSALEGVGMSTLYGSLFAAHGLYGYLGALPTALLLLWVSLVAGLRSVATSDNFMAWLGLFGALLTPWLVAMTAEGPALFFLTFLLLATFLWAATVRRWPDIVIGASIGSALLYLRWSYLWFGPERAAYGLLMPALLAVPFAVAALPGRGSSATRLLAAVGATLWIPIASIWLIPVELIFSDPRSYLVGYAGDAPHLQLLGALALCILPLPAWMVTRAHRSVRGSTAVNALVAAATAYWAYRWSTGASLAEPPLLYASIAPFLTTLMVHQGQRRTGAGAGLLLVGWLTAYVQGVLHDAGAAPLLGSLLLVTVLAVVGSWRSSTAALLLSFVLQAGLALAVHAFLLPEHARWIATAVLVLLGLLPWVGLRSRWPNDPIPSLGWIAGLFTTAALAPAAYLCWKALLGTAVIGLVPLFLGAHALLGTAVLIRHHRQPVGTPSTAVGLALVLTAITFTMPLQLREAWLTVGWALEAAALATIARRFRTVPLVRGVSVFLACVVSVRLLLDPWAIGIFSQPGPLAVLYVWSTSALCIAWVARSLQDTSRPGDPLAVFAPLLRIAAMLVGFVMVNLLLPPVRAALEEHLGFQVPVVRSLAWAGWGIFLLALGVVRHSPFVRYGGFTFLLLAAAKVFLFDLWAFSGLIRVLSLTGLGLLSLVAAILFNRFVFREPDTSPGER